jgi:hypothetical protein
LFTKFSHKEHNLFYLSETVEVEHLELIGSEPEIKLGVRFSHSVSTEVDFYFGVWFGTYNLGLYLEVLQCFLIKRLELLLDILELLLKSCVINSVKYLAVIRRLEQLVELGKLVELDVRIFVTYFVLSGSHDSNNQTCRYFRSPLD